MFQLAIYILLAPLVAFTINIFWGKRYLPRGGDWISITAIWSGCAFALYMFFTKVLGNYDPNYFQSWQFDWIRWGDYQLRIGIALDNVSLIMLVVVTLVSSLIHLYSTAYMKGDPKYHRFFAFLSFFSFSMIGLVLADNLLIIFCFWELVGLSSYFLIGFWHEKDSAANAAKKAFVANRIGDVGMLIGILLVFTAMGTLNVTEVIAGVAAGKMGGMALTIAGLCLFCGAIGKSAQFPLHVWLPDAMEGPTPVSALIHAATMVAAGVYLVVRIFAILTPEASLVIAYIGGFTALFAATIAVAQYDIKRVLAYSTLSQLGYMVMALGVGSYTAGFFHLVTHAMFKACLFLGSGSVIHAMHGALHHIHSHDDAQDMRFMGGLKKYMPVTFITFLIATVSLSGVPLTSGFMSKDAILGGSLAYFMMHPQHWLLPVFGFGAAILTAFYMFRLVYMTFFGEFKSGPEAATALHESPRAMTIPLIVLGALSIFVFYSFNPFNPASGWFSTLNPQPDRAYEQLQAVAAHDTHAEAKSHDSHSKHEAVEKAEHNDSHGTVVESHGEEHGEEVHATDAGGHGGGHDVHHTAHLIAMVISIILATLGILIATMGYYWHKIDPNVWKKRLGPVYLGMYHKWWWDEIYEYTFIGGTKLTANILAWFDGAVIDGLVNFVATIGRFVSVVHGWFDLYVVDGLVNLTAWIVGIFGRFTRLFQGGQIQRYVLYTIALVAVFIILKVL
ncbi:MAG: NADH-quinone oxidoreductase subunit L [Calditrichaeota bacterium]|nr:NADH-quinone oxidoreductase subunit L [Calditrichota bacterium]